ncbi:hypothetical protein EIP91_000581 [Steccherinum ochraceum]|uniref:Uncharacterized protein n=1 Tax=Steccherinum ochraceum TaxID=92696 RepID=A0A4R0RTB4_9APHY|nr:hypothetical protein EIP91_000581 [Steccherinum ochraceum]
MVEKADLKSYNDPLFFDPNLASERFNARLSAVLQSLSDSHEERLRSLEDALEDDSEYLGNTVYVNMPPTRYATRYHPDGRADVTSVDWEQVVNFEPTHTVEWIQYLHAAGLPEIRALLSCLATLIDRNGKVEPGPPMQWDAYAEAQLPCVLLDIASEPDMFQHDPVAFKSMNYSAEILQVILFCLFLIMPGGLKGRTDRDLTCMKGISSRIGRFSRAMWEQRHLHQLPLSRDNAQSHDNGEAPSTVSDAFNVLVLMDRVYTEFHRRHEPLSMHVAHVLIYHWVYSSNTGECKLAIRLASEALSESSDDEVTLFTHSFLRSCRSHFPEHLSQKMSRFLRDDSVINDDGRYLVYVCTTLWANAPRTFSSVMLPEGFGLVPSLLIHCQRQLCSSTAYNSQYALDLTMQILFYMLAPKETRAYYEHQLDRYAGELNLIGLIKTFFVNEVQDAELDNRGK